MAMAEVIGDSPTAVSAAPDSSMISTRDLWKTYDMGLEQQVHALRGIDLRIERNEYVAIIGPSGSGKSTLMNLIGCLDSPSKGQYWLNGQLVQAIWMTTNSRTSAIKKSGLCSRLSICRHRATALHNVELPLIYAGAHADDRATRAKEALASVGMEARMIHKPMNSPEGSGRESLSRARW